MKKTYECEICGEATTSELFLCFKHRHAQQCELCGEWIRIPVRIGANLLCTECRGAGGRPARINTDKGWISDSKYNGDTFNTGEW